MACDLAVQHLFPKERLSRKKMLLKLFSPLWKRKKRKTMEITKPQLSCSQSSLEWTLTKRGCHETKGNFPFPSPPPCWSHSTFQEMAAIQRALNLCKSTAAHRWNQHCQGPPKADLDVQIEILSPGWLWRMYNTIRNVIYNLGCIHLCPNTLPRERIRHWQA